MKKNQVINKLSSDLNTRIKRVLLNRFKQASLDLQQVIIGKFDEELVGVVTDRNSKTNPNLYREEFIERLAQFNYVDENPNTISLMVPDMETFNFSGRMKVIEAIMSGLTGVYVEMSEDDYISIFGKKPINQEPLDEYVSPKERVYLVKYTGTITKAEKELNKKFVRYPFSNTGPIDIFSSGEKFVNDNINNWIESALEEAQKSFTTNYKGAKF